MQFGELVREAEQAEPFRSYIDPDDDAFLNPAHMPRQIQKYCEQTGQAVPRGEGEIIRCVMESLALKYRYIFERTEQLAGASFTGLHMVGGGIHNELLCQFTANAIGKPVWAGPAEGSALGNIGVQLMAIGEITSLQEARDSIRRSFPLITYMPQQTEVWEKAYQTFAQRFDL
jgi:rhamnulokinase